MDGGRGRGAGGAIGVTGVTGAAGAAAPGTARASTAPTWSRVYQASSAGTFLSIAAISARNVWAVGLLTQGGRPLYKPFIRHFDGSAWTPVTFPRTAMYTVRVQATSASNVWVFGYTPDVQHVTTSAAYRWDGKRWHKIPLPAVTGLQGHPGARAVQRLGLRRVPVGGRRHLPLERAHLEDLQHQLHSAGPVGVVGQQRLADRDDLGQQEEGGSEGVPVERQPLARGLDAAPGD